jgi:hypothetical protein
MAVESESHSGYNTVLETSQRWADFLQKKERQEVIWRGIIAGIFQWSLLPILAVVDTRYHFGIFSGLYGVLGNSILNVAIFLIVITSIPWIVTTVVQRVMKSRYSKVSSLIASLRDGIGKPDYPVFENTLKLLDAMGLIFPDVKRNKFLAAAGYGILMFTIVTIATSFLFFPWSILVGLVSGLFVWYYLRSEAYKDYNVELGRFQRWTDELEQGKKQYLQSL